MYALTFSPRVFLSKVNGDTLPHFLKAAAIILLTLALDMSTPTFKTDHVKVLLCHLPPEYYYSVRSIQTIIEFIHCGSCSILINELLRDWRGWEAAPLASYAIVSPRAKLTVLKGYASKVGYIKNCFVLSIVQYYYDSCIFEFKRTVIFVREIFHSFDVPLWTG